MTARNTENRRLRTRKDLLSAGAKFLREGKTPTLEEIANEAMVSRATAYRYFPTVDALLAEAPVDTSMPNAEELFPNDCTLSIEERVDAAEAAMHESMYRNETQLRLMLSQSLARPREGADPQVPVRQNRRAKYIDTALRPYRRDLSPQLYEKLSAALALLFGTESMIVFRDVHPLSPARARAVKSWAIRTLVRSAVAESKTKGRRRPRTRRNPSRAK